MILNKLMEDEIYYDYNFKQVKLKYKYNFKYLFIIDLKYR